PLLIWLAVMLPLPEPLRYTVNGCVTTTGRVVSATVTKAVPVPMLPLLSRTANVTAFTPRSLQEKSVIDSHRLSMPQLSDDPLLISLMVIPPLPDPSRYNVNACVATTGRIVSSTVTTAVPVFILPLLSRTNNVTILMPVLLQENAETSSHMLSIPQLSEEPLLISQTGIPP